MKKILISGAGIAGLTAAIRLSQAGFQVVVVEKSETSRAGGFLVALSHQSYVFAKEMGLMEDLEKYNLLIRGSSYHDRTGRCLLDLNYSKMLEGLDIIQLMRGDLAHVLYQRAQDLADIRFDETIQDIHDKNVTFSSGQEEEYDIIIGADGAHSGVRKIVFNDDEIHHDYLNLHCAAFRLPNVVNIDSKFETHMERQRYMAVFNTLENDIGAVFVWANEDKELPAYNDRSAHLLRAFGDTSPITQQVLEHCPENSPPYIDVLSQIHMPKWHKGRSIVIGDAAHCLTLFSGRGAAAAFAGACRLCNAIIENTTPEDAFIAYEEQMRPIINDIMPATRNAVKWYVPMSLKNHMIRDGLMRFVPNGIFHKYFKVKYSNV